MSSWDPSKPSSYETKNTSRKAVRFSTERLRDIAKRCLISRTVVKYSFGYVLHEDTSRRETRVSRKMSQRDARVRGGGSADVRSHNEE